MKNKVIKTIEKHGLIKAGDRVLKIIFSEI